MSRTRNDLLLVLGLLLAAGICALALRPAGGGAWAVVEENGTEIARYSLSEDRTVRLEAGGGYNLLTISAGRASVAEADCGDHTCVNTGWIDRQGEAIICLPHRLVIHIEGGGAPAVDAVAS